MVVTKQSTCIKCVCPCTCVPSKIRYRLLKILVPIRRQALSPSIYEVLKFASDGSSQFRYSRTSNTGGTSVREEAAQATNNATVALAATVLSNCPEPPIPVMALYIPGQQRSSGTKPRRGSLVHTWTAETYHRNNQNLTNRRSPIRLTENGFLARFGGVLKVCHEVKGVPNYNSWDIRRGSHAVC